MQYRAALAAAALAPLATAFTVTITSNCDYTVYGWNVVDSYGPSGQPTFTLSSGNSWTGPFEQKSDTGGPSIKLQTVDSLFENAQQSQVEYDMAGSTLFYDLSNINGFPFSGSEVTMQTSNGGCPTVNCPASDPVCSQAYNQPNDLRTLACDGGANIEVFICGTSPAASSSPSSSSAPSSSAAPAPPPAATTSKKAAPAPAPTTLATSASPVPTPAAQPQTQGEGFLQAGADGDVEVVIATTVVAVTNTVVLPAPTGEAKRDVAADAHLAQHLHQRGHLRVMGRHAQ